MILDVGSGNPNNPYHIPFNHPNTIHVSINPSDFHLECVATVYKLPFIAETFNVVRLSHVLEHLDYPLAALKECARVSSKYVIVKVPNASRTFNAESQEHISSWNQHSLRHLCLRVFGTVEIYGLERQTERDLGSRIKSFIFQALFRPNSLTAFCRDGLPNKLKSNCKH